MTASASNGSGLPARTLLGHCEIRRILGQGGGGISYLAYDAHLEREVVIKEHFPPSLCFRAPGTAEVQAIQVEPYNRSLAAFCREARILAGLNHPGIVKVYDIFQAAGTAYMVMEFVDGARLTEWLPEHAGEVEQVISVLVNLLGALSYLHGSEVLHRDIKPSNIIIRTGNQPVLIDFGAAMLGTPPTTITLVGTPGYAAPEQFQPHGKVGAWSDLYALAHSFAKHIPAQGLRRYPRCFVSSLRKAAVQDWERRTASAAEWKAQLQKRRSCWWIGLAGLVAGVLLATGGWVWMTSDEPSDTRSEPILHNMPEKTEASVLTPEVMNRLQHGSPEETREQLQDLKRMQRARLEKFAEQMNSILPEESKDQGWKILPGQGDIAEEAQEP